MKFPREKHGLAVLESRKVGKIYYMPLDPAKTRPKHADWAPRGEIRQERRWVLVSFTWIIALALASPLLALVFEGFRKKHFELSAIGSVLIAIWSIGFLLLLWQIISSRTVRKWTLLLANRSKRVSRVRKGLSVRWRN